MSLHATVQWDPRHGSYLAQSVHGSREEAKRFADLHNPGLFVVGRFFVVPLSTGAALRLIWRLWIGRLSAFALRRLKGEL